MALAGLVPQLHDRVMPWKLGKSEDFWAPNIWHWGAGPKTMWVLSSAWPTRASLRPCWPIFDFRFMFLFSGFNDLIGDPDWMGRICFEWS